MLPTEKEERIHALDSLRAVAMFLGIVLHGAVSFAQFKWIPWPALDARTHWGFDLMIGLIHGFRMHLFFLLAGFFARLLHDRMGARDFAKQRLKRIGIPFVVGWVTMMPLFAVIWQWGFSRHLDLQPTLKMLEEGGGGGIPTAHLWFLEFLLIFYALAIVCAKLPTWLGEIGEKIVRSPARFLLLAAISILPLWNGPFWGEPDMPGARLTPRAGGIVFYGMFFAVGWLAHARRELLASFQRWMMPTVVVSVTAYAVYVYLILTTADPRGPGPVGQKLAAIFCASVYAWGISFVTIGFFLRFVSGATRWGRYLADASYWCYLAHLPLVNVLQILIARIEAPGILKFALMMVVTMGLLLVTYEYCVRYTIIGRVLNGPRTRPS